MTATDLLRFDFVQTQVDFNVSVLRNSQLGPAVWDDELLASETCQVMAFDRSFGGFGYLWRSVWIYNKYIIYL